MTNDQRIYWRETIKRLIRETEPVLGEPVALPLTKALQAIDYEARRPGESTHG